MEASLDLWVEYIIRFSHLVAGIAWIGSSFYFIWLDGAFETPEKPRDNVDGEVFMVHGGFYYQVDKKKLLQEVEIAKNPISSPSHQVHITVKRKYLTGKRNVKNNIVKSEEVNLKIDHKKQLKIKENLKENLSESSLLENAPNLILLIISLIISLLILAPKRQKK